ncbi:MAG: tyrosine-type recombinase/integrase [Acidobacteriaceae bacterium]
MAALLRTFDGYQGTFTVACALRLAPLVFVRPGELRKAEWADIDLEAAEWRYTVTKTGTAHIVPLSTQALAILGELHAVKDPNGRAYNRTAHLPERRKMMQTWADYLDTLKAGAEVIPLHGNAV